MGPAMPERSRRVSTVVRLLIVGFWVVMMALLFRREVLPVMALSVRREGGPGTYEALVRRLPTTRTVRMGVYWPTPERRVGTVATTTRRTGDTYHVNTVTRISSGALARLFLTGEELAPGFAGPTPEVVLTSRMVIGPAFRLVSFSAHAVARPAARLIMSVKARPVGKRLLVTTEDGAGRSTTREIRYDPQGVISQAFGAALSAEDLSVGRRWSVRLINPLTGSTSTAVAEVTGRSTLEWNGAQRDVFVVETSWGLTNSIAWVTPEGEVLQQRAPFGVTLIREPDRWSEGREGVRSDD